MTATAATDGIATKDTDVTGNVFAGAVRNIRSDVECRAIASTFLTELIGWTPDDLVWDETHHLQGHSRLRGRELVVIAPRDDRHRPVLLTAEDWDAVRRANPEHRRQLLDERAIADRHQLVAALRSRQRAFAPFHLAA